MKTAPLSLLILSLSVILSSQLTYDPATSAEMARASFASYCGGSALVNMKCGSHCNSLKGYQFLRHMVFNVINDESVSYTTFVNPTTKRITLAFRGTVGNTQLVTELFNSNAVKFDICGVNNAFVASYFFDAYKNHIRTELLSHLKSIASKYPDYDFFVTGHSLGGALANLAALDIKYNGFAKKENIYLYTFGSPRVGDATLAKAIEGSVHEAWRITHNKDIVPHVPFCQITNGACIPQVYPQASGIFNNAWHVGQEVFYSSDFKTYKMCQGAEDMMCSNQWKAVSLMWSLESFKDHLGYFGVVNNCS